MNKIIGITQRIDFNKSYNEKRDCLDLRWHKFLIKNNLLPLPLPNLEKKAAYNLINNIKLSGLILSGGNTLYSCSPNSKDASLLRDQFEMLLIDFAIKNNIPIIGVCRGMQIINKYFNGKMIKIKNKIKNHKIKNLSDKYELPKVVNSFHNWGIDFKSLSNDLVPIALDHNDNIEAFMHPKKKILGIMWHPERDYPFNKNNLQLFKNIFS